MNQQSIGIGLQNSGHGFQLFGVPNVVLIGKRNERLGTREYRLLKIMGSPQGLGIFYKAK